MARGLANFDFRLCVYWFVHHSRNTNQHWGYSIKSSEAVWIFIATLQLAGDSMDFVSFPFPLTRKLWLVISNRYLNPPFIHFTTISIISIGILSMVIAFWTSAGGRNIYGSWAGGDYSCFYIAGKILNDHPPDKLYDFGLQSELLHFLLPEISKSEQLPYVNPPFFALIFRPLSHLPYMLSYFSWIFFSILFYVFGFRLIWKTLDSMPTGTWSVALLLALSFEPFFMETIFGGNSSAIGFFTIALFLYFEYLQKDFLSGVSLGILLYKPTLLIFLIPMLLFARRTKTLLGFSACSIILIFLSILTVGFETCIEYIRFLLGVSTTALGNDQIFREWKYVDIFSFSRLLFRTISPAVFILIALMSLSPFILLIKLWWKSSCLNKDSQELLKASAITLTTIVNLHFGIYDTVILVLSILLTVNIFYRSSETQNSRKFSPGFKALLASIYIIPWISQHLARTIGFQPFTFIIAIMAGYQILIVLTYSKIFKLHTVQKIAYD